MIKQPDVPAVEIQFVGRDFRKPPLVNLLFDLSLRNPHTQPRWFLIPATLDPFAPPVGAGGVNALDVYKLGGEGDVIVGRFLGKAGFQALLLPADAAVKLRRFPVSLWEEELTDAAEVEVVVAHGFTVGGESAEAWFGLNPASDARADVMGEQPVLLASKPAPGLKTLPVSIDEECRIKLPVNLVADESA